MSLLDNPPIPLGKFETLGNGYRIHYHEAGRPSADKPTLLFLHGSGPGASGYSNFDVNFPFFADSGYHVLVPDYLGYGLSDKPTDFAYTSTAQVTLLNEFIARKGVTRLIPIGNSLGGAIAFEYALTHPHEVAKVVAMGPGGVEDHTKWSGEMSGLRSLFDFIQNRKTDRESFRQLLHHIVASPDHITDYVIDSRLPVWLEQPPEVYSTMQVVTFDERLAELKMPVLCLWGQKDNFLPVRHALRVAELVSDARVVISTRAGHWFMQEETAYFNREVLDFIAG